MTTDTTTAATTPATTASRTKALRGLTALGGVATIASTFLSWTYTDEFPGDLTVYGYPGGLQVLTLVAGALVLLYALAALDIRGLRWLAPTGTTKALRLLALGAFATTWFTVIAIAVELGGIVNLEPGGFVAAVT
ncbi:branched-chain amino acid ABC transporter permease, partial [[Kitasatospora] papulosa]